MLCDEEVLSFTEASKILPKVNGRRPHASTIWRWARKGCQGVRLEVRRLGGRFLTSREALERFSERLGAIELPERPATAPKQPIAKQRQRSIERANRVLAGAGITGGTDID